METMVLWLLLGFGAGLLAVRWRRGGRPLADGPATATTSLAGELPQIPSPPDEPVRPRTRTERLHQLARPLDAVCQSSSHANEVKGFSEFVEAVAVLAESTTPLEEVIDYAKGTSVAMAAVAFAALARRPDGAAAAARITDHFDTMPAWQMQHALEFLAGLEQPLPAGAPLIGHQFWWDDNTTVAHVFADYLEALDKRGVEPSPGPAVGALEQDRKEQVRHFLSRVRHAMAARLAAALASTTLEQAPPASAPAPGQALLDSLGRYWTAEEPDQGPIEPADWSELIDDAAKTLERTPIRSLLVSGDPLIGKTSFLRLLASRLEKSGWRVFEASGADLQAGQLYIGQLEGRIREAVEQLAASKKVIWYVPDLLALALSGANQSQSATILDQILPAIAAGRLVVWGEASPTATARLLQMRPAVRRAFEVVRLEPLEAEATLPIAKEVAQRLEQSLAVRIDPDFPEAAIDAARHYLSANGMPGSVIMLMKLTGLRTRKAKGARLAGRDLLEALAQLTGLPQSILDGSERLDLAETGAFFSRRVIGQPEAVASVVERIAMLKSGLNDPMKPFGVFLFAGPTGTGKTELAKAIADYLFGSTDRMIRLDMSEYQAPDAIQKIMGGPGLPPESDTLVARIRKQPFSLVLLDEFEKSSPNIWDLFLQVFDEGRLTDAFGQTADFRHCLIILTTNLGATSHQSSGVGFAPRQNAYTDEQVLRSIGQTFRPEFQNRLDKVIVFRPLTREHMRGILKKELNRLFERRGLKDREWAIEWEASALEFLLEKGFSPDMGARPLKRAIDQHVVAPLAAAIVERRAPEGEQFVFVRSDGDEIKAEFVDPDGDGDPVALDAAPQPKPEPGEPPTLADLIQAPELTPAALELLEAREEQIGGLLDSENWTERKAALTRAINDATFWSRPDRFEVLASYELMDRLAVAAGTARSLKERLIRSRLKPGRSARDLVGRLAQQVWLVGEGLRDLDESAPVEVALMVEPALEGNAAERAAVTGWQRQIADMYRGWARRRGMQLVDIGAAEGASSPIDLVSGFGAHRILAREVGLHVLEAPENGGGPTRIAVRVLVVPSPPGDLSRAQRRAAITEAFQKAPRPAAVVRRYRRAPSPLVRSADGGWRSGKLDAVLAGEFDVIGGAAG